MEDWVSVWRQLVATDGWPWSEFPLSSLIWLFLLGCVVVTLASVYLCGRAEKTLGETDPPSVVLDEIIAIPICFIGWIAISLSTGSEFPGWRDFIAGYGWLGLLGTWVAFRFFDILKPWPIDQIQAAPGGWGVTLDDVLSAVYVNLLALAIWSLFLR